MEKPDGNRVGSSKDSSHPWSVLFWTIPSFIGLGTSGFVFLLALRPASNNGIGVMVLIPFLLCSFVGPLTSFFGLFSVITNWNKMRLLPKFLYGAVNAGWLIGSLLVLRSVHFLPPQY